MQYFNKRPSSKRTWTSEITFKDNKQNKALHHGQHIAKLNGDFASHNVRQKNSSNKDHGLEREQKDDQMRAKNNNEDRRTTLETKSTILQFFDINFFNH